MQFLTERNEYSRSIHLTMVGGFGSLTEVWSPNSLRIESHSRKIHCSDLGFCCPGHVCLPILGRVFIISSNAQNTNLSHCFLKLKA